MLAYKLGTNFKKQDLLTFITKLREASHHMSGCSSVPERESELTEEQSSPNPLASLNITDYVADIDAIDLLEAENSIISTLEEV